MTGRSATAQLAASGVSVWLDDLSRQALDDGSLATLVEEANVTGVTTNPTIFHRAIVGGHAYDAALAELASADATPDEAVLALTVADVTRACDLLAPVWRATDGVDGRVSIEVDPRLARDTAATIAQARVLHASVGRPNVLVKIPATVEGLPAIEETVAAGIDVNVTLVFSVDRYRDVIHAFQAGVRRAHDAGLDVRGIHSVASFFVSRLDAAVDRRLRVIDGASSALAGRAGIANALLAYEVFRHEFASASWAALAASGARRQRPLWASTGVKDPAYPDTMYVTELVADGVVNTMPRATLEAVQEHAILRGDTVTGRADRARALFAELAGRGVDYDEVVAGLESEALAAFVASWDLLLDDVGRRLGR